MQINNKFLINISFRIQMKKYCQFKQYFINFNI